MDGEKAVCVWVAHIYVYIGPTQEPSFKSHSFGTCNLLQCQLDQTVYTRSINCILDTPETQPSSHSVRGSSVVTNT
jgi:hypothetical protein